MWQGCLGVCEWQWGRHSFQFLPCCVLCWLYAYSIFMSLTKIALRFESGGLEKLEGPSIKFWYVYYTCVWTCYFFIYLFFNEMRLRIFFFLRQSDVFIYLFIHGCAGSSPPREGLSPAAASGGQPPPRCAGPPPSRPPPPWSTGSRRAGPATVAHGPSRSAACGILPDQGPNPRPLNWQADSQPLRHQESPKHVIFF